MIPDKILQLVLSRLAECAIPYMITGSFASNMHGVPRSTYDADVVIEVDRRSLDDLLQSLGSEFYASSDAAEEALTKQRMFNVVHLETGFKVDFIIKKNRPFSREEFSRRDKAHYLGQLWWFATPEDVILTKLEWSKMGDSERQFMDALNIAKVQGEKLDRSYLKKWAEELGIHDLLESLLQDLP